MVIQSDDLLQAKDVPLLPQSKHLHMCFKLSLILFWNSAILSWK